MSVQLSLLMLQLESRDSSALCDSIRKQIAQAPPGSVEFLFERDNGELTSGQKRNRLMSRCTGDRVAFIDDDDLISDDYVSSILSACADSEASVITFNLEMQFSVLRFRRLIKRTEYWRLHTGTDNRTAGLMSANHLCAWKSSIARKVAWDDMLGYGDDQLWYKPIINCRHLSLTSFHIEKTLYFYMCNLNQSANQSSGKRDFAKRYSGLGLRCYWNNGDILVEVGQAAHFSRMPTGLVRVRDADNNIKSVVDDGSHFFSCKIT